MKLDDWKRAIICVEAVPGGGLAVQDDASREGGGPRSRIGGTAIYVRRRDRRFLVTARHLLTEPELQTAASRPPEEERPGAPYATLVWVPNLDDLAARPDSTPRSLATLYDGPEAAAQYSLCEDCDLAVISLDTAQREALDELDRLGYRPVSVDEIEDRPPAEGAELVSLGFPRAPSPLAGKTRPDDAGRGWWPSLPVFAFGRAVMVRPALDVFWASVGAFPGSEGGPVTERGRLVGVISRQTAAGDTPMPYVIVTVAGRVRRLIEERGRREAGEAEPQGKPRRSGSDFY